VGGIFGAEAVDTAVVRLCASSRAASTSALRVTSWSAGAGTAAARTARRSIVRASACRAVRVLLLLLAVLLSLAPDGTVDVSQPCLWAKSRARDRARDRGDSVGVRWVGAGAGAAADELGGLCSKTQRPPIIRQPILPTYFVCLNAMPSSGCKAAAL